MNGVSFICYILKSSFFSIDDGEYIFNNHSNSFDVLKIKLQLKYFFHISTGFKNFCYNLQNNSDSLADNLQN